jgi:hypothetical protein
MLYLNLLDNAEKSGSSDMLPFSLRPNQHCPGRKMSEPISVMQHLPKMNWLN